VLAGARYAQISSAEPVAVAQSEEWALALVGAGIGIAIVPEGVARDDGHVVLRPLADVGVFAPGWPGVADRKRGVGRRPAAVRQAPASLRCVRRTRTHTARIMRATYWIRIELAQSFQP
jgi:hypothetical protein